MYEDTKLLLESYKAKEAKEAFRKHNEKLAAVSEAAEKDNIWAKLSSRTRYDSSFIDFKQKVTDAFVTEGIVILVDNCMSPTLIREDYHQKLVRQLASNFVKEEGSMKLLNKFRSTSYLMSEMAYAIDTTVQSILEKADKNNSETFKIEKADQDKFYDKLGKIDADEAVEKITNRVREQTSDFVNDNMADKAKLAESLSKTQKKVENNKNRLAEKANDKKEQEKAAKIEESYIALGKRRDTDIRNSRSKNIFEHMVYNLSKSAMVNESASKAFVSDSKLDMEKIVEHCETVCTFITTLDSLNIINVDESYIENMLKEMKK